MARKALGKGLGALIPGNISGLDSGGKPETAKDGSPAELDVKTIKPNPYQPREIFSAAQLQALADSIREQGILQPVVVRRVGEGYELIAGERRLRAAKQLGYQRVPAIIKAASDEETAEWALVENVQRDDLTPLEEAQAYKRLMELAGLTQEQVAKKIGKDRATVANTLRLLKLPKEVQAMLEKGELSQGHGKVLAGMANPNAAKALARKAAREGWNVRQLEEAASNASAATKASKGGVSAAPAQDSQAKEIQERLRTVLATKVKVKPSKKGGKIEIEYYSAEELSRIAGRIEGE